MIIIAVKKRTYTLLVVFFSILFVLAAAMLIFTVSDREKAKQDFDELAELVVLPEGESPTPDNQDPLVSEEDATSKPSNTAKPSSPPITRNISLLKEMNSECVGWIYIKGTKVNYPVMHSPSNPEKYLKKNFYGQYSGSGVPFIDARCDLKSTNIIIYGHNMKNLTMFGGLRKYLDKNYLNSHPIIEFETSEGLSYYKITQVKKTTIKDTWFTHNLYAKQDGKEYLTLSTCTGTNKNARLLVIAEKITEK